MKRSYSLVTAIIFFALVFSGVGISQTLQETLSGLSNDAAQSYVSPIISAFGSNLNSGWVHKSPSSKVFGIDIEVGIVAMATMFGDNNKTFLSSGTFRFNNSQALDLLNKNPSTQGLDNVEKNALAYALSKEEFNVSISGPTIVGKKESEVLVGFGGKNNLSADNGVHSYNIDPTTVHTGVMGFLGDAPALPLVAPQFSIGTVYGTMATFRFLPSIEVGDLGKFSYFGFGLQHNPAMFIPVPLPVDVSAAFFTQSLKVGDIFKTTATTFGIYASRTFGWGISITPFAGFAIESSSVDVAYDVEYPSDAVGGTIKEKIEFSMKGENSTRLTIGASLKLALLNLSVDYSLAQYNAASLGVSFIF